MYSNPLTHKDYISALPVACLLLQRKAEFYVTLVTL